MSEHKLDRCRKSSVHVHTNLLLQFYNFLIRCTYYMYWVLFQKCWSVVIITKFALKLKYKVQSIDRFYYVKNDIVYTYRIAKITQIAHPWRTGLRSIFKTQVQQSKQRWEFSVKAPVVFNLQMCLLKHCITWNKQHELILVGIVPRKMKIYLYCLQSIIIREV